MKREVKSDVEARSGLDARHRDVVRRVALILGSTVVILCLAAGGWAGYLRLTGNIHEIEPGIFRSGQLDAGRLSRFIAAHRVGTVFNLRGAHEGRPWFDAEAKAVRDAGVDYVSIALSADHEPTIATVKALLDELKGARTPLLIHCEAGADRSGLAAALYERLVLHRPRSVAAAQLSFRYGHFSWLWSRSGAMDRSFSEVVSRAGS